MTHPKPFKDLSDAEKGALLLAHHEGKRIEHRWPDQDGWERNFDPSWLEQVIYRIAPEPLTPDTINWDHVAPEYNFMARAQHGAAYLFRLKPRVQSMGWSDGNTPCVRTEYFASYRRGTVNWKDSLVIRPGYEASQ